MAMALKGPIKKFLYTILKEFEILNEKAMNICTEIINPERS